MRRRDPASTRNSRAKNGRSALRRSVERIHSPRCSPPSKAGIARRAGACGNLQHDSQHDRVRGRVPRTCRAFRLQSSSARSITATSTSPSSCRRSCARSSRRCASGSPPRRSAARSNAASRCRARSARPAASRSTSSASQQLGAAAAGVARAIPGHAAADDSRHPALAGRHRRRDRSRRNRWPSRSTRSSSTALSELTSARAREGAKLRAVLEARCTDIEAQLARVTPRIPALHAAYMEKLGGRLREAGLDPNDDRLKQELALFATRSTWPRKWRGCRRTSAEIRRVLSQGGSVRQAPRFPRAGAASRSQHARLEVGRRRAVAGVARAQGADRADARASAESRMKRRARRSRARPAGPEAARSEEADAPTQRSSAAGATRPRMTITTRSPRRLRLPVRRRRALGRRQEQHGERAARARARNPPVGVVHDAAAASGRVGRQPLSLRRRADVPCAEGQRRISGARVCPWQLVRYIGDVAHSAG